VCSKVFLFSIENHPLKEKKDKKRKPLSHAGVGKMQGRSEAELCIILAFLWWVSPVGSPHIFADFFCDFITMILK